MIAKEKNFQMKSNKKTISSMIKKPLFDAGFALQSRSFYLRYAESIHVVNIQKSDYGDQYYINIGVALTQLEAPEFPKDYHCHIRFRLTGVMSGAEKHKLTMALNMENSAMSDSEREKIISISIRCRLMPFLRKICNQEGIAKMMAAGALQNAMVHKQVRELISANSRP